MNGAFMGREIETLYDPRSRKRRIIRNLGIASGCVLMAAIAAWKVSFAAKPAAVPALTQQWHEQVYSLDEDETVRFIPPPYTPLRKREKQLGFAIYGKDIYHLSLQSWTPWQVPKRLWIGAGVPNIPGPPPRPTPVGNVRAAVEFCALGYWPDAVVAEELKNIAVDGDWIVRGETPFDQRMIAMQSILKFVTGRDLVVAYEPLEHEVDDWSLLLEDHGPLKVIKDRVSGPGVILRERKRPRV